MKKTAFLLALVLAAAALFGCTPKDKPVEPSGDSEYGCADYYELADTALLLAQTGNTELMKKLMPKEALDSKEVQYTEREKDYWALLQQDFDNAAAAYTEAYGEGWKLSYTFTECRDKDEEGIQQYRDYDGFYFEQYGMDPAKIEGASCLYAKVTASSADGSKSFTKNKNLWAFKYEGRWYSFYMPSFGLKVIEQNS